MYVRVCVSAGEKRGRRGRGAGREEGEGEGEGGLLALVNRFFSFSEAREKCRVRLPPTALLKGFL
jgi:hypothetical protein